MGLRNKIVWSEGMFLRPQHFQQENRYVESLVRERTEFMRSYSWGFSKFEIADEMLRLGKIALRSCEGVFPDGTPFSLPEDAAHPVVFEGHGAAVGALVHLCIPATHYGASEYDVAAGSGGSARYMASELDVADAVAGAQSTSVIRAAKLKISILAATENRANLICMPIARIVDLGGDGSIVLDSAFIPPLLSISGSTGLKALATEIVGLLEHRAHHLAPRVAGARQGTAEIADFLLLQVINRASSLLKHKLGLPVLHPEDLYAELLCLAGELATFSEASRRAKELPPYQHDDLKSCFRPLVEELRRSLSSVLEQSAVQIALQSRPYGIKVGAVSDSSLFDDAMFVLSAKASVLNETLRTALPALTKIGSIEEIRELINAQLAGVRLSPLSAAPRQLPFYAGAVYFELDRQSPQWRSIASSAGLALHVAGDFPDLQLELWAIRQ